MKQNLIPIVSVLAMSTFAFGQSAPASSQAQVGAAPLPVPRVQVFEFAPTGQTGKADGVGRGIQENLQNDVSHTGAMLMMVSAPADPSADPVAAAKKDGATLAVIGSYQVVDDQIRVNGHMVDTASNAVVGSFSSTGQQKDLFKVEDALGEQMRRLLPLPAANAVTTAQPVAPQQADIANPPVVYAQPVQSTYIAPTYTAPAITYSQPPVTYYDNAAAPYYYPDSFYGGGYYPGAYFGPFIGFYGGGYGYHGYYHGFAPFHTDFGFHGGSSFHGGGGFHGSFGGGFHGGGGGRR